MKTLLKPWLFAVTAHVLLYAKAQIQQNLISDSNMKQYYIYARVNHRETSRDALSLLLPPK